MEKNIVAIEVDPFGATIEYWQGNDIITDKLENEKVRIDFDKPDTYVAREFNRLGQLLLEKGN